MAKLSSSDAIVECLRAEQIDHVFGVPGGQTLSLMNSLYSAKDIRFITARHEMAAANMADAYGRITGRPGVLLVTTGPGATNAVTGVAGAFRDSSPLLALTINNRRSTVGWDEAQDMDHVRLFRGLTKHSRYVDDEQSLVKSIREAFRIAQSGNPGAVHVDIARDVLEDGMVEFEPSPALSYRAPNIVVPSSESVEKIRALIEAAKRPLLWVGNGVRIGRAGEAAVRFATEYCVPVITTFNGIGAVPMKNEIVFTTRSRSGTALADFALSESDLVIALGNSLNAISTSRWTLPLPQLVHVDIDPEVIGRHYPTIANSWADAASFLNALLSESSIEAASRQAWRNRLGEERVKWEAKVFTSVYEKHRPIAPQFAIMKLSDHLEAEDIVVCDAGNPGVWAHLLKIDRPDGFMKPVGFGNMGFGLPAAIAAKLVQSHRRVVALMGDGSLGMSLAEIETAVREKTPLTLIVLNDCAYGNIKQEQLLKHGPRYLGVDFTDISYAGIAKSMGADGERVEDPAALPAAYKRALGHPGVYLLDIVIDGSISIWEKPI
jgi:acetolactate synthase I/II/III large subunit